MSARFARLGFAFRFAYRNIIHYRLRSILIFFSFTALFTALLIGFSMPDYFKDYYYGSLESRYQNIDLVMRASPNSNTRFFSLRTLYGDPVLDDHVKEYAPFFEVDTLIEIEDQTKVYLKAMASTTEELMKITGLELPEIGPEETILTETIARRHGLEIGDTLNMVIGQADQELEVVRIVSDTGLFSGDTIFIDREGSLRLFLRAIDSPYANAPWVLLDNIYNTVYFSLYEDRDFSETRAELQNIEAFSNLEFEETINARAVDQLVRRATSVFNVIFVIIVFAILFVLQTTFLLFFNEKRRAFGITAILGGRRLFTYSVALIEIAIFYVITLLTSNWLSNLVIREGSDYVGTDLSYRIKDGNILVSASIVFMLFLVVSYYYFRSFDRRSSIEHTKDLEKANPHVLGLFLVFLVSLSGYLLISSATGYRLLGNNRVILQLVFVGIILFSLSRALIESFVSFYRKPRTGTLYLKILLSKKAFFRYLQVLVISMLSMFLLILTYDHINHKIETIESEYHLDYVLTNLFGNVNDLETEIRAIDGVKQVHSVGLYHDVAFQDLDESLSMLVSLEPNRIDDYFTFDISSEIRERLQDNEDLSIVLPERFRQLNGLSTGDVVTLELTPEFDDEHFLIVGFFDKEIGNLAFTNIHLFGAYAEVHDNAIFVNATPDARDTIIDAYSKNLIYVIDYRDVVSAKLTEMTRTLEYIMLVLIMMIACFVLAIIVHSLLLLDRMKAIHARFIVLGTSRRDLTLILLKGHAIVLLMSIVSATLSAYLIGIRLPDLMLVFNEYEAIVVTPHSLTKGILISVCVLVPTYALYVSIARRTRPMDVLKND